MILVWVWEEEVLLGDEEEDLGGVEGICPIQWVEEAVLVLAKVDILFLPSPHGNMISNQHILI